jgi:hypothetical protein
MLWLIGIINYLVGCLSVIPPNLPCWYRIFISRFGIQAKPPPWHSGFPFSFQTNPNDKVKCKPDILSLSKSQSLFLDSLLTREVTLISVIPSYPKSKNRGPRLLTPAPHSRPKKISPLYPSSRHNRIPLHVAQRSISAIISRSPSPHPTNHLSTVNSKRKIRKYKWGLEFCCTS